MLCPCQVNNVNQRCSQRLQGFVSTSPLKVIHAHVYLCRLTNLSTWSLFTKIPFTIAFVWTEANTHKRDGVEIVQGFLHISIPSIVHNCLQKQSISKGPLRNLTDGYQNFIYQYRNSANVKIC